jgi:hypothetical protein
MHRTMAVVAAVAAVIGAGALLAGCAPPAVVLRGSLTVAGVGGPAVGVQVTIYSNVDETVIAQTASDASGDYSFDSSKVPPGTYRIRFSDNDWWSAAADWTSATPVALTTTSVTTIDDSLTPATGSVSGTAWRGTARVAGAKVEAISTITGSTVASTTSAADGTYSFGTAAGGYASGALPVGDYRIRFTASGLTTRFSGSVDDESSAPVVTVSNGASVTGIDATLAPEARIQGVVIGVQPLPGMVVSAYTAASGDLVGVQTTDSNGRFAFLGLDGESYRLMVVDPTGVYRTQAWGSTSSSLQAGELLTPAPGAWLNVDDHREIGGDCDPAVFVPGADLAGRNLAGAHLQNCGLAGANLEGADLSGADVDVVDFTGANLRGANLSHIATFLTRFTTADLSSADLSNADFSGAVGSPSGGATAVYDNTRCPDSIVVSSPNTCVGHGMAP